jgi:hypothetical protein
MTDSAENTFSRSLAALVVEDALSNRWFDFGVNPPATEVVGAALADATRHFAPTVVVSWSSPDEFVLAHIVARELGATRAGVELDLGLLTVEPVIPSSSRVLLLATFWGAGRPLESLHTLVLERGHTVVAAASLIKPESSVPDIPGLEFIVLGT